MVGQEYLDQQKNNVASQWHYRGRSSRNSVFKGDTGGNFVMAKVGQL